MPIYKNAEAMNHFFLFKKYIAVWRNAMSPKNSLKKSRGERMGIRTTGLIDVGTQ